MPPHRGAGPTPDNLGHCPWAEVTVENFVALMLGPAHAMLAVTLRAGGGVGSEDTTVGACPPFP